MDESKEGALLIGTSMVVLVAFVLTVLAVMIIYRKRRIQHEQEIALMNEKFTSELLQTQLEVQQQTMHHIGREIHDSVGQQLTLAYLYAQQIEDSTQKAEIERVASTINNALTDLRNLSKGLVETNTIQSLELAILIQSECDKLKASKRCDVKLTSGNALKELSPAVKIFVLRIFQEFVQNSMKHANCSMLTVELRQLEKGIQLAVEDNGEGFSINHHASGVGISNMKRRAAIIGGTFSLESSINNGTKMCLFVPTEF